MIKGYRRGRCRLHFVVIISVFLGGFWAVQQTFADTNLVNNGRWALDGIDDTGTNPVSMAMTVKGKTVGSFTELAVSYNVGGTGVVTVATVKGSGVIRLSLPPPGEFGGSFYTAGYWDCDEGFIPTMMITGLDVRVLGGKKGALELRGKISNGVSMEAKDFMMKFFPPVPDLTRVDVSYTLFASSDMCIDQGTHTNADDFPAVRMAANYLSADTQENDQARYVRITEKVCVSFFCVTKKKSFCDDLVDQDGFIVDPPANLRGGELYLVHTQPVPQNTPTLQVKFIAPSGLGMKAQGFVNASADPTAQNVNLWANWTGAKASYREGRRITKFHYSLQVVPPTAFSCNQED
jgi:hypothetical protein